MPLERRARVECIARVLQSRRVGRHEPGKGRAGPLLSRARFRPELFFHFPSLLNSIFGQFVVLRRRKWDSKCSPKQNLVSKCVTAHSISKLHAKPGSSLSPAFD